MNDPVVHAHAGRMARGSALLVSSGVVSFAGSFALAVVIARTYGKLAFGLWAIAFSLGQLLSIVGQLGADWIVMRQGSYQHGIGDIPRLRATIHVALALAGVGLALLGAGLFLAAGPVARSVFHDAGLEPLVRLTAVMAPVVGMRQVLVYATQAFKEMRDAALIRNVLQPSLRLLAVGALAMASASLVAAYAGLLLAEVLLLAVSLAVLWRRVPLTGDVAPVEPWSLIRFALPAWGSRLAGQSRGQIMPVLLGSIAAVIATAVYAAANRIAGALTSVVNSLNQVYTSIGSDLYLQGKRTEFAALYRSATRWTFTLGAPLLVLMLAFPHELLSVFGPGFIEGTTALRILALGMLFNFGTGPVTVTLIMTGRSAAALADYLVVIALEIGLAFVLIPRHGVVGAAIAKAAGTASNNVVPLLQIWARERILPFSRDVWKPGLAASVAAAASLVVVALVPVDAAGAAIVAAGVVAVAYVVTLWGLGLSEEDRRALRALRVRGEGSASGRDPDQAGFVPEG
ncbi:MAG: oligosaccharide flippase family protein [Actinomycetota bacterium]